MILSFYCPLQYQALFYIFSISYLEQPSVGGSVSHIRKWRCKEINKIKWGSTESGWQN